MKSLCLVIWVIFAVSVGFQFSHKTIGSLKSAQMQRIAALDRAASALE